jgi:hypothetical protein
MRTDLTRREVLATVTTGVVGGAVTARSAFAAEAPFHCGGIDHLALAVDDVEKSVHFYARVFGATVMREKTNTRHYVKLGPNYIAMAPPGQGQTAPSINHCCPGIVNFDLPLLKTSWIKWAQVSRGAAGWTIRSRPGRHAGPALTENPGAAWAKLPAGCDGDARLCMAGAAAATAIDHILVNVSDVQWRFYQRSWA